jgi:hypothetical protein
LPSTVPAPTLPGGYSSQSVPLQKTLSSSLSELVQLSHSSDPTWIPSSKKQISGGTGNAAKEEDDSGDMLLLVISIVAMVVFIGLFSLLVYKEHVQKKKDEKKKEDKEAKAKEKQEIPHK